MIEKLSVRIRQFPGLSNQVRCFLHIVSLVGKSLLKQFELPKKKATDPNSDDSDSDDEGELDDGPKELLELAEGIELETPIDADNDEDDDDVEGWVDELEKMTEEERTDLMKDIRPIQLVLFKVSSFIECSS